MKKKHKITLLVIGILLALSLMLSSSYALWVFNVSQESTNVLVSDCFELTLTDNNPIGLGASFPMRDSDGVKTTPYTFTIRNICNHPADFQINLETLNTSTIDESFIKVDLNGHITEYNLAESVESTIEGARSAAMLYEDTIEVGAIKLYNARIWIKEDAVTSEVENKSYASKITVRATVRKKYDVATLKNGSDLNVQLKTLAGDSGPTLYTYNVNVTSIERSLAAPQESDNAILISDAGSAKEIYAWFSDGVIYIYSDVDKIYMNSFSTGLFKRFKNITSLDLSYFDTSKVENMSNLFSDMSNLTSIDLSNFDTSNVTNMNGMLGGLSSLSELDVSNLNTSKVTNMSGMFWRTSRITSLDLSHFDTSNVTTMENMFAAMTNLEDLDLSGFNTSKVINMSGMFSGCSSLPLLNVSNFDTSKVTDMSNMFQGLRVTELDLESFDTSKVTNMKQMFDEMSEVLKINLRSFDTSSVVDMSTMFGSLRKIRELDLSNFNTSNVTNMSNMFAVCEELRSLNISSFDTSNVTNMNEMFYGIKYITELDLSSFDTSNVTNMNEMFEYDNYLVTIYVGTNWNTSKLKANTSSYWTSGSLRMFLYASRLVGGAGTTYSSSHVDKEYARVDGGTSNPGYLTLKTN